MQDESKKQNGKKPLPKSILKKPTGVAKSAQPELLVQQSIPTQVPQQN
jgi:hypothetical protein